jgi:hypothetical protein
MEQSDISNRKLETQLNSESSGTSESFSLPQKMDKHHKIGDIKKIKRVTFGPVSYITKKEPAQPQAIHSVQEVASSTSNLLVLRGFIEDRPVRILIDSGANGLGFISEKIIRRDNLQATTKGNERSITLADGSMINSKGYVTATLSIPSSSTDSPYLFTGNFLVVPLEHDFILGKAWLSQENPIIDWNKNIVKLPQRNTVLLGEDHQSPKFLLSSMQLKKSMNKKQIE